MLKRSNIPIYIIASILLALTVFGSIYDLEIAGAVYIGQTPSENIFGIIFSFIGVIPTFVGWSFLGASILCLTRKQIEDKKKKGWLTAFAILLFVLSFFYYCNTLYISNSNVMKMHFLVAYSIGLAVISAAAFVGYKLSEKSDNTELLKKILLLAAASLVTLLIISITKEIMCRPRFRYVLAMDSAEYFRSWWQNGRSLKAGLGDVVTDEFASMPSGHSAYSMFAIFMFPALSDYIPRLEKFRLCLFALGFIWWAVTAFSRMTMGAHYLTDVVIAGLITILAYAIVSITKAIYSRRKSTK